MEGVVDTCERRRVLHMHALYNQFICIRDAPHSYGSCMRRVERGRGWEKGRKR